MILTAKARVAGVIGWPVEHSLSPRLHGFWLDQYGIDGTYIPLPVHPDHFAEALRALPRLGFRGANVTVPHKETALRNVDHLTGRARRIGAVNTVTVGEDGSLTGDNTDGFGFLENLRQGAPEWKPSAGRVVVLGAGGAARGVVAALVDAGVPEVVVLNRTLARAEALAADLGAGVVAAAMDSAGAWVADCQLLVNTTSLGMAGGADTDTLPAAVLTELDERAIVNDIVYTPLITPLLEAARHQGNRVVDGLGMLLHQARPGFEAWFGVTPEVDEALRAFVLKALEAPAE